MKYIVKLRVETYSGITAEMYSVTARNAKAAESAATVKAFHKHGRDNVIEIFVTSVTEVDHAAS